MAIVHYMHKDKLWYYWIDNSERKKYWRKVQTKEDLKYVNLLSKEFITEKEARKLLKELFPNNKIMKAFPYHHSPETRGTRPFKTTVNRKKMLKEKIEFREELKND